MDLSESRLSNPLQDSRPFVNNPEGVFWKRLIHDNHGGLNYYSFLLKHPVI
jgi:hypothetical protein